MMDDGELLQVDGRWQVRFVLQLPHPPEKVWRALTEPEHLAAWFPTDIVGERAAGAVLRFVFRNGEAPEFHGRMVTCDPPSVLELLWGNDLLRFTLVPEGGGTRLTFTDTLEGLGKAARDAAGWHVCLELLGYDLDQAASPWAQGDRWRAVHPGYVERFGPEAATEGPPAGHPDAE